MIAAGAPAALALLLLVGAAPAAAADSDLEVWLNPSVAFGLGERNELELETAQRFRDSARGRPDTYFGRLWLNHQASDAIKLGVAIERRLNDGAANETRLMQQVTAVWGIIEARARLEQRFVDRANQTGLRLRTRVGLSVPLDEAGRWSGFADAEPFFTLVPTSRGGDTGFSGLRTQVGVGLAVSSRLDVSLGWLRMQETQSGGRPDRIAHAPIMGLELGF